MVQRLLYSSRHNSAGNELANSLDRGGIQSIVIYGVLDHVPSRARFGKQPQEYHSERNETRRIIRRSVRFFVAVPVESTLGTSLPKLLQQPAASMPLLCHCQQPGQQAVAP